MTIVKVAINILQKHTKDSLRITQCMVELHFYNSDRDDICIFLDPRATTFVDQRNRQYSKLLLGSNHYLFKQTSVLVVYKVVINTDVLIKATV